MPSKRDHSAKPPPNKGKKYPAERLTKTEVQALIKSCSSRAPTGIRNRALITVLWRAGLRIAEALALRVIDVDRDAGTICVLHGKGRKARTVGIDPGAMAMVERWLDARARLGINGHSLLFCTLKSGQIHPTYVRAMLKRKARKAGIERRVHPHGLRHTLAAEMREEGADIGVISKQLGHSSIATTARYVDHLAPTVVIETMQKRTWDIGVH